ncbi:UNVERIFIED_CONTAM: leader peptidase (prepilin peptidase)/N-methyltransferase [Acetivibrio alkalicellulosi]
MAEVIYLYINIALVGLLIGSFLNVCIYRIPKGESVVKSRSHCMKCGNKLSWLDLFPVFSYLFLKGKCRYCKAKISPRYALVELFTGLVFVLLFAKYGFSSIADFIAASYLMSILIVVFFIDLDHLIIPDELVITGLVGGVILIIYNAFYPLNIYGNDRWWSPLVGSVVGFGILLLIGGLGFLIYRSDEAFGGGDVKIFAPIGLFLGWQMTLVVIILSAVLASIIGVFLIVIGVKDRKSGIPFGPFIVIGTFMTYLFGQDIINWYIGRLIY